MSGEQATAAPANRLEELLAAAVSDPGAQPAFFAELLRSELYAVGRIEGEVAELEGNRATLEAGTRVNLFPVTIEGEPVIAAFTSPARLEQAAGGEAPFVGLPATVLLRERPRDLKVVLNPGVWYGKELLPGEIAELLGERAGETLSAETVLAGEQLLIGLPAEYPSALAEALSEHFESGGAIEEAYLGHVYLPASEAPPHPVVGVKPAPGRSVEDALAGVDALVRRTYDGTVDFVPLADDPISEWLLANTEPFYRRGGGG